MDAANPVGLRGIEFTEFNSKDKNWLHTIFSNFGFSKVGIHSKNNSDLYVQNGINFIVNNSAESFSNEFEKMHGPPVFCVENMILGGNLY